MINKNIGYIILEGDENSRPESTQTTPKEIGGHVVARTIVQTGNEKNRNGRWYTTNDIVYQLTKAPRTLELVRTMQFKSEAGHPMDTNLQRQSTIDPMKVCAVHLKFWNEGNDIWSEYIGSFNALGDSMDRELRVGAKPAWSLRALGSINQTSRGAEVTNLRVITYDHVIYPSHSRAYTQSLVESANMVGIPDTLHENDLKCEPNIIPVTNTNVINFIQAQSSNLKFVKECCDFAYDRVELNESGTKAILRDKSTGDMMVINLESYIHNELMTYASDQINKFGI